MSDKLGPQFIPEKYHDFVWEATLRPDLDREYTTKSGEPYIIPGHLHFDVEGAPYIASSLCTGRDKCPPPTQAVRRKAALRRAQRDMSQWQ